jgi:hypothetical protein
MQGWRTLALGLAWSACEVATTGFAPRNGGSWCRTAALFDLRAWPARRDWPAASRWIAPAGADAQRYRDGCGAAALAVILREHGPAPAPQSLLWNILRLPHGGTTLGAIARTARRFGVDCELRWEPRPEHLPVPSIVHLRRSHFVVVRAIEPHFVEIFDPACGVLRLSADALASELSGAALAFATIDRIAARRDDP